MDSTDLNGLSVDEYADLGRIAAESAYIEHMTDILIRICVGDKWVADLFTTDAQWNWRYEKAMLLVAGTVDDEATREAAFAWLGEANDLQGARNRLLHSMWSHGSNRSTGELFVASTKMTARNFRKKSARVDRPMRLVRSDVSELPQLVEQMRYMRTTFDPLVAGPVRAAIAARRRRIAERGKDGPADDSGTGQ